MFQRVPGGLKGSQGISGAFQGVLGGHRGVSGGLTDGSEGPMGSPGVVWGASGSSGAL